MGGAAIVTGGGVNADRLSQYQGKMTFAGTVHRRLAQCDRVMPRQQPSQQHWRVICVSQKALWHHEVVCNVQDKFEQQL
jgi:hypothetical protein